VAGISICSVELRCSDARLGREVRHSCRRRLLRASQALWLPAPDGRRRRRGRERLL